MTGKDHSLSPVMASGYREHETTAMLTFAYPWLLVLIVLPLLLHWLLPAYRQTILAWLCHSSTGSRR